MSDGYGGFDVKQLWHMVDSAKQGLAESTKQVGGWLRAQQMLNQHATALSGFREQLAAQWPPETSAASAAYLAELDRLLTAVVETAQSSGMNASYVGYVADAIEQAHVKLKPIHDEYVSNESKLDSYQAQLDAVGTAVGATRGSIVGAVARGGAELFTSSPVDDGRQEELLRQARQVMVPLSETARSAANHMQPPPVYIPPDVLKDIDGGGRWTGGSFGSASRSSSMDSGSPSAYSDDSDRRPSGASSGVPPTSSLPASSPGSPVVPSTPGFGNTTYPLPPDLPTREVAAPSKIDPGPVLSGEVAHPAPPLASPVHGSSAMVPPSGPPPNGGLGSMPGVSPGISLPSGGAGQLTRPHAPSAVIGGSAGSLLAPVNGAQRVSPVGGVIGHQPGGVPGVIGGNQGRQQSPRGVGQRWDPDNPWAVEYGVAPVIAAEPIPSVNPGPGIIGMDR